MILVVDSTEQEPGWKEEAKNQLWAAVSLDGSKDFPTTSATSATVTAEKRALIGIVTDAPVLIFANRHDERHAMTTTEVRDWLELPRLSTNSEKAGAMKSRHEWHIQGCNGLTGDGLQEGISWLLNRLSN